MKKIHALVLAVLLVLLLVAEPIWAQSAWSSNGPLVNPTSGTVMADTGPLAIGAYSVLVLASASVVSAMDIQVRDSTNTITVNSQQLRLSLAVSQQIGEILIFVNDNERIRVVMAGTIVGTAQASVFTRH